MAQDIVLLFFNSFAGKYLVLDWFVTAIVPYFFLALLLLIVWRRSLQQMLIAALAWCSIVLIDLVSDTLLMIPRPFMVLPITTIAQHAPTNSFPSGHTLLAFTLAFVVFFCAPRRWERITALALAAVVGLSRLYLGVHWTVDVVASSIIAFGVVYLIHKITLRYNVDKILKEYLPASLRRVLRP